MVVSRGRKLLIGGVKSKSNEVRSSELDLVNVEKDLREGLN